MIRVRNLTKRYGPVLAVDDISFEVEKGGVVGFLGPNGAGKTTTIRILTCYHPATSGQASIGGDDVFSQSQKVRRRIGYLPESAPLYPEMRSREYLDFRGRLRGLDRSTRSARIDHVSDRCRLTEFIDRPIGHLSKGMRQRVGLADAMLHDPEVLILDEPTIGLDPTQIRETRRLIRELGTDHTVLLSSHILTEVEQICDRTIIIANGRIADSGRLDELRARLSEEAHVVVELQGPAGEIVEAVKALAGVQDVASSEADDWTRLEVAAETGRDVRADIFGLAAAKGWTLRELSRTGATLEDFFIKVTAAQAARR
jgi:ABC-2 type transport system ATP-binding protein